MNNIAYRKYFLTIGFDLILNHHQSGTLPLLASPAVINNS